mmetsp:Transcript_13203/g.45659  ORF Transcript_13203/g.45659 Transcript_13203/m.45659 type:complete len:318 (+) Transcript_13203:1459-2412(+)
MGVNASEELSPDAAPALEPYFFCWAAFCPATFMALDCAAAILTRPLDPPPPPSCPMPSPVSPISSSASLKPTRFAALRMSVMPYFSFILRKRFPPLRFLGPMSGAGRGLMIFAGGGSCHAAIFLRTSASIASPAEPSGLCLKLSTRAMSVHLAPTRRAALGRSAGGVSFWSTSHWNMNPACSSPARTAADALIPPSCRLRAPSTWTLHAGIWLRGCSPPATPMSLAAISVPTTRLRLGAMAPMRLSTKRSTRERLSSRSSAASHASTVRARHSSLSGSPLVVDAVTVTTMIAVLGRMPSRFTDMRSISLPMWRTTRA